MPNNRSAITTTKRTAKTSRYFTRNNNHHDKKSIIKDGSLSGEDISHTDVADCSGKGRQRERGTRYNDDSIKKRRRGEGGGDSVNGHAVLSSVEDVKAATEGKADGAGSSSCRDVKTVLSEQTPELHAGDGRSVNDAGKESVIENGTEASSVSGGITIVQEEEEEVSVETCHEQDSVNRHDASSGIIPQPPSPEKSQQQQPRSKSASPRKKPPKLSPYFPKPLPLIESSCLPFPPISAPTFGLIQEQLSSSPFRLLIATIFLNRTRGPVAIPVLFQLFQRYPTISDMACAKHADIVDIIRGLGFQNQRATKFIALARKWLESPPERGRRYRKLNYPCKRDGADVAPDEVVGDEEDEEDVEEERGGRDQEDTSSTRAGGCRTRVAWEIAHLPGIGAYAIDSWRIFCRDRLRYYHEEAETAETDSFNTTFTKHKSRGRGANNYEPEWKRVLPHDKELRAYLSWKWLKEGWVWNCENGQRTKADVEMMKRAEKGGVAFFEEGDGHMVLMNNVNHDNTTSTATLDMMAVQEGRLLEDGWIKKAGFSLDYS